MKKILTLIAIAGIAISTSACSSLNEYAAKHPSVWSPVDSYGQGGRGEGGFSQAAGRATTGALSGMACGCHSNAHSGGSGSSGGGHGGGNH